METAKVMSCCIEFFVITIKFLRVRAMLANMPREIAIRMCKGKFFPQIDAMRRIKSKNIFIMLFVPDNENVPFYVYKIMLKQIFALIAY